MLGIRDTFLFNVLLCFWLDLYRVFFNKLLHLGVILAVGGYRVVTEQPSTFLSFESDSLGLLPGLEKVETHLNHL